MALVDETNCGFVLTAPTEDPAGSNFRNDGQANACKFTSPSDVIKITEIGWWCDGATSAADFDIGLYSHDAGNNRPGNRLFVSANNPKGTTAGWKKITGLDWSIEANTIYWIAVQLDATIQLNYANYAENASYKRDYQLGATSLLSPWGTSHGSQALILGFFAVYTTEAPPNPYPVDRLRKDVIHGYNCFMNAYVLAKLGGFNPLKLPDGTVF